MSADTLRLARSDLFDVLYGALVSGALERCKTERELGPLVDCLWSELETESPTADWECGSCGAIISRNVLTIGDLYHAPDADCRTVRPAGPVVNGEVFALGYTREAAEYEQRTR